MNNSKKKYTSPEISEVKFEDKNLVTFFVCSKQTKTDSAVANDCCDLLPLHVPGNLPFDPS